jgi:NAD(P)H-hydrate epimerase
VRVRRDPSSHKGQNGKVMVIGGCKTMHGAPLFSALSAEASGVDLLYVAVPAVHQHVAREQSLNIQVHPFAGDELTKDDVDHLLELLATVDAAVIGPGLSRSDKVQQVMRALIAAAPCPLVLDASALQRWTLATIRGKTAVVTPHLGELERMGITPSDIAQTAHDAGITIHEKGAVDRIAGSDGEVRTVPGGNAGLTVGGTGDALAGLICGLIAQGEKPVDACVTASTVIKRAGTVLLPEKGFAYTTQDVIAHIPHLLAPVLSLPR